MSLEPLTRLKFKSFSRERVVSGDVGRICVVAGSAKIVVAGSAKILQCKVHSRILGAQPHRKEEVRSFTQRSTHPTSNRGPKASLPLFTDTLRSLRSLLTPRHCIVAAYRLRNIRA